MNFVKHLKDEIRKYIRPYIGASDVDPPLTARQLLSIVERAEKLDERDFIVANQSIDTSGSGD